MNLEWEDAVFLALFSREKKSRWAFCDKNGEKLKILSLWKRFSRQLKKLGIRDANLHTWRQPFASYLTMRTGNIRAVQRLLGHNSIRTTEIYSRLSERHLHNVVGQLHCPKMGTFLAQLRFCRITRWRRLKLKGKEWAIQDLHL